MPVDELAPRERLLRAADRLMHDHGYAAVGVADICRQAGAKKGSFYHFFDSKQALAIEMLDASWHRTRQTIFATAFDQPGLGTVEAFTRYGDVLADHLQRLVDERGIVSGCRFGNFATELAATEPAIRACLAQIFDAMTDVFVQAIERGHATGEIPTIVDARQCAGQILALMEGLMTMAKAMNRPDLPRQLGPAAARLLETPK